MNVGRFGLFSQESDARQPEAELYVFIAEACFEAGDRAGTVKYCEEAKKHGLTASEQALAFAEGEGEAEEAVEEAEEGMGTGDGGGGVEDDVEQAAESSSAEGTARDRL